MAAGVLVAITIIVAVFASGVTFPGLENNPGLGGEQGRLIVLLKDAPVDLDRLMITISDLEVHKIGTGEGDGGEWIDLMPEEDGLDPEPIGPFDLLELQGEQTLSLFDGLLVPGTYNKIRMYVSEAKAFYDEEQTDGVTLKVPPGKIDVITEFELFEGGSKVVLIDMEPDWVAISKSDNFRPILKATISEQNPPIAEFTYTSAEPTTPLQITFDASPSSDIDGTILSYDWEFVDDSTQAGKVVEHTYDSPGTYTIILTVEDNDGLTDALPKTITIPIPPTTS